MIKEDEKAKLNKKLVDLVNYHVKLKEEKKELVGSYNEQIKEAVSKIDCIGKAIQADDKTILVEAFQSEEIDAILR